MLHGRQQIEKSNDRTQKISLGSWFYLRENAKQWLDMVTWNGITNKGPWLVPHQVKKVFRIKLRETAATRTPPPVEVPWIRSSIFHTILMAFYLKATLISVKRTRRVRYPFSGKQITLSCNYMCMEETSLHYKEWHRRINWKWMLIQRLDSKLNSMKWERMPFKWNNNNNYYIKKSIVQIAEY